jgi:5-(carboxyamino)imidazole ribonucleotide mutase
LTKSGYYKTTTKTQQDYFYKFHFSLFSLQINTNFCNNIVLRLNFRVFNYFRVSKKEKYFFMKPIVSIIMGSVSDFPIMEEAAKFLEELQISWELNALSAHRTPELVGEMAKTAKARGIKVIIAGAGGAAHLPGVVAAFTSIPVIGVPIKSSNSIDGWDSVLSILQMPSGIPVATVALNGARNAGILAAQIIASGDENLYAKLSAFKESMKKKVIEANEKLQRQ